MTSRVPIAVAAVADRSRGCAPKRRQPTGTDCCLTPDGPPPDRPDLATYSQSEQFALGNAPTWDSPDILSNYWDPFRLMPEITVTVRNLSPTATAVNGQVLVSVATFGIGQPHTPLGAQSVTLAPGQQTSLLYPLPQAVLNAAEQRIAVGVRLVHPYDSREINNVGAQLLADVYTSKAGRSISVQFPVVNSQSVAQTLSLQAMPNLLSATVTPAAPLLGPAQQIMATLHMQVPAAMHGTRAGAGRRHRRRSRRGRQPDRRADVRRVGGRLMKALLGVLAGPVRALFVALGIPFRNLPFCSLPGSVIGALTGFLMSLMLREMPGVALTPQQLIVAGLLFGFVSLLLVLFLFGILLRYGVAQIFPAALGNALVTAIVVVFITYWMQMPAIDAIVGLLVGVLIGALLCWICGLDARRTHGAA